MIPTAESEEDETHLDLFLKFSRSQLYHPYLVSVPQICYRRGSFRVGVPFSVSDPSTAVLALLSCNVHAPVDTHRRVQHVTY